MISDTLNGNFIYNKNNNDIHKTFVSSKYDSANFDSYDNFYTILYKRRYDSNNNVKRIFKIIYGHFIDNDNLFLYKYTHNNSYQGDASMCYLCSKDDLMPNSSTGEYFRIPSYKQACYTKQMLKKIFP